jgi:hypothetical protein
MNNKFTTEILIDYLDGTLLPSERVLIEDAIKNDVTIQQELDKLSLAQNAIQEYGLQRKVRDIHTQMMLNANIVETEKHRKVKIISLIKPLFRIAAIFLLTACIFLLYQYKKLTSENVLTNMEQGYYLNKSRAEKNVDSIINYYGEKKYQMAIDFFSKKPQTNVTDSFFAAQSYLALGNSNMASTIFNTLNVEQLFKDDVDYYKGIAYLKSNNIKKAYEIFKSIKENKNHLYNDKITKFFMWKLKVIVWKNN